MGLQTASEGLRQFLWQELENDSNATVGSARKHLQDLYDEAPGDSAGHHQHWLVEMDELLQQHDRHTAINDLFSKQQRP